MTAREALKEIEEYAFEKWTKVNSKDETWDIIYGLGESSAYRDIREKIQDLWKEIEPWEE